MIKYLGSKRTLIPRILEVVQAIDAARALRRADDERARGVQSVIDLFSGTSRVGHALKRAGYRVLANDHNAYAAVIARCYVQADREELLASAAEHIARYNQLPPRPGYFTETFCRRSRFFQEHNGARVDAIREAITKDAHEPELEAVLLTSLMEAADRVDSTTGVQMAYLKSWAQRSYNALELRTPDLVPRAPAGKSAAHQLDAAEAARTLSADIAYIDPPYNQHKYLGNYHIWETLVCWDQPETYGVACKRVDCRERTSPFNSRRRIQTAIASVFDSIAPRVQAMIVSFSNEGFLSRAELEEMLARHGHVTVLEHDYKRYVGAQIGIFNPKGKRVGKVSHLRNKELMYVVGGEAVARAVASLANAA